jgi:hypothetical protein
MTQTKAQLIDGQGEVNLGGLFIDGSAPDNSVNLDSSGRLLVGTSAAIAASPLLQVEQTTGAEIALGRQDTSVIVDDLMGGISFWGRDTSGVAYTEQSSIKCFADGTHNPGTNPTRLVFSTTADGASSPTERMRILNNGLHRMLSSTAPTLEVRNTLSGSGDPLFQVAAGVSDMSVGGSVVMRVMGDGDVENATGVYTNPVSDERFKTDIVDVGSQWNDIKNVKLKKFRYKNNPDGELQLGIIAQELEPICPNLIKRKIAGPEEVAASNGAVQEGEEYLSWKASLLPLKAVKALQEAMERIETLEARLTALETA